MQPHQLHGQLRLLRRVVSVQRLHLDELRVFYGLLERPIDILAGDKLRLALRGELRLLWLSGLLRLRNGLRSTHAAHYLLDVLLVVGNAVGNSGGNPVFCQPAGTLLVCRNDVFLRYRNTALRQLNRRQVVQVRHASHLLMRWDLWIELAAEVHARHVVECTRHSLHEAERPLGANRIRVAGFVFNPFDRSDKLWSDNLRYVG